MVFIDFCVFFFKQKTAYEMRISDWSSDVCSSDLDRRPEQRRRPVVIALVERVDRAEVAAEAQLDRVAGRNGLNLGEQALGFGEFAEVRALQRAVQREFGGVDAGGRLFIERAARQRLEKFGGLRSEEHTSELQSLMRISYAVFC